MSRDIKLKAEVGPYSSVVGGGLQLTDDSGKIQFMVLLCGHTGGIEKDEDQAISRRLAYLINEYGLTVPARQ